MPQNKPHDKCGATGKQSGAPCGRPAGWGTDHVGTGRCKLHGGVSKGAGAPVGNTNPKTHGLFSRSLGSLGREVYEQAEKSDGHQLARDAANFALAKVAEAYGGGAEVKGVLALVDDYLDQLLQAKQASPDAIAFVRRKLTEPDIATLGKALGPLKGLLEMQAKQAPEDSGPGGFVVSHVKTAEWQELVDGDSDESQAGMGA